MEIKAQLSLIKKLWSDTLEFQRTYEEESKILMQNLKENLENQLKSKILQSTSFQTESLMRDSRVNFSEALAKKDQTISLLLLELEKWNNFHSDLKNSQNISPILDDENKQLKELLNRKEIEIFALNDKINEYEGMLNYNNQQLIAQNQIIQDLNEKNAELNKVLNEKIEIIEDLQKEINKYTTLHRLEAPLFKENEPVSSPPQSEIINTQTLNSNSILILDNNQHEKDKKLSKNVKFNFVENELTTIVEEREILSKEIDRKSSERFQETEKKKYSDEIKRLKEKIYNLTIERENLIWSESNAIKQLQDFQIETGKLSLLLKEQENPPKNKETNLPKKFKKSQTMQLTNETFEAKRKENEIPIKKVEEEKENEENLISNLEEIVKMIEIL